MSLNSTRDLSALASVIDEEHISLQGGGDVNLTPDLEPICLARKAPIGSVAQNTLNHGCGGLNIDACRVGTDPMPLPTSDGTIVSENIAMAAPNTGRIDLGTKEGRWPANLIHDSSDEVVELFPQTGPTRPDQRNNGSMDTTEKSWRFKRTPSELIDNGGSAARFFYSPKADKDDRPHGKGTTTHPTVKPLDLMRYLVRLACVKGGTMLDPFMGSGSTGCAAIEEGMWFVGVEQSQEYADIAIGRLKLALENCKVAQRYETKEVVVSVQEPPPPPRRLR